MFLMEKIYQYLRKFTVNEGDIICRPWHNFAISYCVDQGKNTRHWWVLFNVLKLSMILLGEPGGLKIMVTPKREARYSN